MSRNIQICLVMILTASSSNNCRFQVPDSRQDALEPKENFHLLKDKRVSWRPGGHCIAFICTTHKFLADISSALLLNNEPLNFKHCGESCLLLTQSSSIKAYSHAQLWRS